MVGVSKGSKTDLTDDRYTVRIATPGPSGTVDIAAVLLTSHGKVRDDDDFIFFNNPKASGVTLLSEETIAIALHALPAEIDRVVVTASTEARGSSSVMSPPSPSTSEAPTKLSPSRPKG